MWCSRLFSLGNRHRLCTYARKRRGLVRQVRFLSLLLLAHLRGFYASEAPGGKELFTENQPSGGEETGS